LSDNDTPDETQITDEWLFQILERVKSGDLPVRQALEELRVLPYEKLGFANIDHHRNLRLGFDAIYNSASKTITVNRSQNGKLKPGVTVVSGGTSDILVAEEAAVTAELMGNKVERFFDIGVAGLHRMLDKLPELRKARVIVVVAGMEGALASVIGGLVSVPVVAVPTSVGYGASFNGLAPLLTMLNSCAPGVAVVNIDNGFGAGYLASMINLQQGGD
jgi:NCAIR mutase (PurE)-related protein